MNTIDGWTPELEALEHHYAEAMPTLTYSYRRDALHAFASAVARAVAVSAELAEARSSAEGKARKDAIDEAILVVHGVRRHYPLTMNPNPTHDALTRAINKLADLRARPPTQPASVADGGKEGR